MRRYLRVETKQGSGASLRRLKKRGRAYRLRASPTMPRAARDQPRGMNCSNSGTNSSGKIFTPSCLKFVHFFHHKRLKSEIHSEIAKENWPVEARLMRYFKGNFVFYNGVDMHKETPKDILDAQRVPYLYKGRSRYSRIRFRTEEMWGEVFWLVCPDLRCAGGTVDGCDIEECPKCHGQLLGCGCWS